MCKSTQSIKTKIWLVQLGEPLPIDGPYRLYRTGVLAQMLADKGYDVTWWASTFDHIQKKQRFEQDQEIYIAANYRIVLLHSEGYNRNVSLQRIFFHRVMAKKFHKSIRTHSLPDLIFSSLPTPELSYEAVQFGRISSIPVVIDVRDLWPDSYLSVFPTYLRRNLRFVMSPFFKMNQRIFSEATGIIGISDSYLRWGLSYAEREQNCNDAVFPLGYRQLHIDQSTFDLEVSRLAQLGVNREKFICCFIGTFGESYDFETVIGAARKLQQLGNDEILFVLCGNGNRYESIRNIARDLNNVVFTGWVEQNTILALMKVAKVGLAPYRATALQELPNKPFEYLSAGLPIVSSLKGELFDILLGNECGLNYEPGDVQCLLDCIAAIHTTPEMQVTYGKNAYQLFEDRFSVQRLYPRLIEHLASIANRKSFVSE